MNSGWDLSSAPQALHLFTWDLNFFFIDMDSFHNPDPNVNVYGVSWQATPKESMVQAAKCSKLICNSSVIMIIHVTYFYAHSLASADIK